MDTHINEILSKFEWIYKYIQMNIDLVVVAVKFHMTAIVAAGPGGPHGYWHLRVGLPDWACNAPVGTYAGITVILISTVPSSLLRWWRTAPNIHTGPGLY